MIAALDPPYSGTDALNYASAFVSKDYRQRNRIHLIADDNVGVTHSGRDDLHQYLVRTRLLDGERFNHERPACAADDGGPDLAALSDGTASHLSYHRNQAVRLTVHRQARLGQRHELVVSQEVPCTLQEGPMSAWGH